MLDRMYLLSTNLHHISESVYQNAAWFIYFSNKLELQRIRQSGPKPTQSTGNLSGAALAQALSRV